MSYYDTPSWSPQGRQGPWEAAGAAPAPGSRPGATPSSSTDDSTAFYYQLFSVDRALEIWRKSTSMPPMMNPRMPMAPPRYPPGPADFDPMRPQMSGPPPPPPPPGGNVQNFYPGQRFGGPGGGGGGGGGHHHHHHHHRGPTDMDPAMQAKRRMAAQRERDLRNYHQEQQFQKQISKPDRALSPNAQSGMSEEDRRDLIAKQHRALYGADSNIYGGPESGSRPPGSGGFRGNSPYDPFSLNPGQQGAPAVEPIGPRGVDNVKDGVVQSRSREGSTSSPASNQPTSGSSYMPFDPSHQASRTTNSSPGNADSPGANNQQGRGPAPTSAGNVAPIGTKPSGQSSTPPATGSSAQNPQLQKPGRTTPLPSPLSYGFAAPGNNNASEGQSQSGTTTGGEKTGGSPSASEDVNAKNGVKAGGAWGNGGSVWGNSGKGGLGGVPAKVW